MAPLCQLHCFTLFLLRVWERYHYLSMSTELMAEISTWSSDQRKGYSWSRAGLWPTATSGNLSGSSRNCRAGIVCWSQSVLFVSSLRGGGELGLSWHRQARVEGKQRGVEDLQACLHHLFSSGVSSPSLTALTACSAGAVPLGALCNTQPHMMRAVTLQVAC